MICVMDWRLNSVKISRKLHVALRGNVHLAYVLYIEIG